MTPIPAPVLAGAALLPPGWQSNVDLNALDLCDPARDILGQLCPPAVHRRRALLLSPHQRSFAYAEHLSGLGDTRRLTWTEAHGFWCSDAAERARYTAGWKALVREYRAVSR